MDRPSDVGRRAPWLPMLAVALWALTAVLSVVIIPAALDVVTRIYAAFWGGGAPLDSAYWGIVFVRQMLTIPLAVFAVVVIIGGAEIHLRNFNTERSWALLCRTLALQMAIALVALTI